MGRSVPDLTVAAGLVCGLLEVAQTRGASRAALIERAGIKPVDLSDQDNRIPFKNYVTLMRAAKELCDDPALGLHFGESNDLARVSVVGLLGYASQTLLEAMTQMNRYGRLVIEFDGGPDRFRLARERGGLWVVDNRAHPNDFPELTESTFARMVCAMRRVGHKSMVKQIHVTHAEPGYRADYDRIFQTPVVFGSDWNAMQIEEKDLMAPVQLHPQYVFGIFCAHADALLGELQSSMFARGRVESALMPILHTGTAGLNVVARKLGLSRQTLHRSLKVEGTTYRKVLDDLRHRMALDYLGAKKVSVNETAYLVGFSDPAAFSRAFKRWTGSSPRAARQLNRSHG
jgi:AraC-like DNA-binding protein